LVAAEVLLDYFQKRLVFLDHSRKMFLVRVTKIQVDTRFSSFNEDLWKLSSFRKIVMQPVINVKILTFDTSVKSV